MTDDRGRGSGSPQDASGTPKLRHSKPGSPVRIVGPAEMGAVVIGCAVLVAIGVGIVLTSVEAFLVTVALGAVVAAFAAGVTAHIRAQESIRAREPRK